MNNWLILNKPLGISSNLAIKKIQKILDIKKIGYIGTLDPLATGVLPVALNEACKLIPYANNNQKSYDFDITFGKQRTTDDAEGDVIKTSSNIPSIAQITEILQYFIGSISQKPPIYSAIKQNGIRSYFLARQNKTFDLPERKINVFNLSLINQINDNTFSFSINCSQGTYIRSIARDIGEKLNSCGYISKLHRTKSGLFTIEQSISIEEIIIDKISESLIPLEYALDEIPIITLNEDEAYRFRLGQFIEIDLQSNINLNPDIDYLIKNKEKLVGIGKMREKFLKPKKLLNLNN